MDLDIASGVGLIGDGEADRRSKNGEIKKLIRNAEK